MKTAIFIFLFLILANQVAAIMVSPAKISGERTITVTNNLKEEANYKISDKCASADTTQFVLKPAQKKSINVKPKCNGYLEIAEETNTAINKMRLPIRYINTETNNDKKRTILPSAAAFLVTALVITVAFKKSIKKGAKLQ